VFGIRGRRIGDFRMGVMGFLLGGRVGSLGLWERLDFDCGSGFIPCVGLDCFMMISNIYVIYVVLIRKLNYCRSLLSKSMLLH